MKKLLLSITILYCSSGIIAQKLECVKYSDTIIFRNSSFFESVASDNGDVFVTGHFEGRGDFDLDTSVHLLETKKLGFHYLRNLFIVRYDKKGALKWVKTISHEKNSIPLPISIKLDSSNNVYILCNGVSADTIDVDPDSGVVNVISAENFILKLDSNGKFVWVKQFDHNGITKFQSMAIDRNGDIILSGILNGTVDLDPDTTVSNLSGVNNFFILKLNKEGKFRWVKKLNNNNNTFRSGADYLNTITDKDANIISVASFRGTVDFNPGSGTYDLTNNGNDNVIFKLDSNGSFIMAVRIDFRSNIYFASGKNIFETDNLGNIYLTGYFDLPTDFDPDTSSYIIDPKSQNSFLLKLKPNGKFDWAIKLGDLNRPARVFSSSMTIDKYGNSYITGKFQDTVDFNPDTNVTFNLISSDYVVKDYFILKLDSTAKFVWAVSLKEDKATYQSSSPKSISIEKNHNVTTRGLFRNPVDFDPGPAKKKVTPFSESFYIHKMSQCENLTTKITANACKSYLSPSGKYSWNSSGFYSDTVTTADSCVNIYKVTLTIDTVDVSVTRSANSLKANTVGASYQWLNCNNNYQVLINDTNQTFNATLNGNYAVEVTKNGCTDTSACHSVMTTAINEQNYLSEITVHPNPTTELLFINLKTPHHSQIIVRNYLSQIVKQEYFSPVTKMEIEIGGPRGLYFVEIILDQNVSHSFKVIKE